MKFQWSADKSERNLRERGFDFGYASRVFDGPTLVEEDVRRDYGEQRMRAIGVVDRVELVVIYTDRTDPVGEPIRRIFSARRANRKERRAYHERTRGERGGPGDRDG